MITQPENYRYWLKRCLMLPIPLRRDFDGLGEALMDVGRVMLTMILRLFVLLTLPVSAPVLAYLLLKVNIKTAARNKAILEKAIQSVRPLSQRDKIE